MFLIQSNKTCPVKMKLWIVVACFYLVSHLLQEIDAVPLGSSNTKEYKVNGETRLCRKRGSSEACPLDHDIGACHRNLALVTCKPCDTRNGYRLCMQVYSDIDYMKCYRLSLDCSEEQKLIIHTDSNGRCSSSECVCKVSEGYIQQGLDCVRLKNKCAVNYSVIGGKCQPCPEGTHKPTVGFEPCSPISVQTTKPTQQATRTTAEAVANLTVNVTGSFTENERSRSQGGTTPGSNLIHEDTDEADTIEATNSEGSSMWNIIWTTIIPYIVAVVVAVVLAVVVLVVVAVVVLVLCKHNKGGIRFCNHCCPCSLISNYYQQADISSPATVGLGEITGEGSNHGHERPSSPPTYQSSDVLAKNRRRHISDSNSIVSHRDSNSDTDEVTQPFIPPTEPTEQALNPPAAITPDWPTLATNGGSSLLPNGATGRPANETDPRGTLLQLDNTQGPAYCAPADVPNVPAVAEAGVDADASADAPTAVADGDSTAAAVVDAATCPNPSSAAAGFPELGDSLKDYDFGSNFSVIS